MYKGCKCCCIILNYNDSNTVLKYINEIKKYKLLDKILIVDNMSSDNSVEILKPYVDEKIELFSTDYNGGYGYGNNYGVKIAKSKYDCKYAFISNPDVSVSEESMKRIIDTIIADDSVCICAPMQINGFTRKKIKNCAWKLPTYKSYLLSSLFFMSRFLDEENYEKEISQNNRLYVDCVPGAFLAIDVRKFLECGGYDENIFLYCEESLLGFRLKKNGYKSVLLCDTTYNHFESSSVKKSLGNLRKQKMILKNRMYYLKNYIGITGIQIIIAKIVFLVSYVEYYCENKIKK